jgi:hypothetical protein
MSFQDLVRRARDLRKPVKEAMQAADLIRSGEEKIGMGDNNLVLNKGEVEFNNEDPAVGGKLSSKGSDMKFGGRLQTDLPIDHLVYEKNRVFNPQIQYRPQNVVSYYPTTLTLPPGLMGGLLKGALLTILQVVKQLSEVEDAG